MTKQTTLTGDVQTRLVNQRNTDEYDIDIGRANGGESHLLNTDVGDDGWLGNPYKTSDGYSREEAVEKYREAFQNRFDDDEFRDAVEELRGKTLACWCTPKACHGDVILEYLRS
ncbi:DUF4326 domain-containing protein [Halomicrococcus sp. NG-SE-24]|uniref:DUF4326 domain-containing protein n=1 Tax=Halomicrococcus sp. NG-SE-24 TaxID=3436928 RepID=UPI003D958599